ncbi:catechol 1,2-dioxygenase [Kocuria sp. JC486]|uniref:Catechol 1,2-dioxygenase n=1 Tax=Kocuria soli TaxID=2485125 RepID=A0A3N3ZU14_9MICC|nr:MULTISPECIES: catechol 1,2-dioxygenase [Kocuria]NHU85070.1 catechol 1,2-dioxygenase [Kocuria sp. JC486]ROZ65808.1 catechol 1,2-dioxygenase [Kocuria soli]
MSESSTDARREDEGTAVEAGTLATQRFSESGKLHGMDVSQERVSAIAGEAIQAINDVAVKHSVTYDEYNALKAWLIKVGTDGEWPLFLDVWLEHTIEEINSVERPGAIGTIEGPYYVPNAPEMATPATLEMREDEEGTPLKFTGSFKDTSGQPIKDAVVEIWHADAMGFYSQYAPELPKWLFRGVVLADEDGNFEINTMRPAPYQIPTDGACGQLIAAAGWHAWRPAHIHIKVYAPGFQLVTQQLYFPGDPHNEDDIASAVKPELMLEPKPRTDGGEGEEAVYNYVLAREGETA